MYTGTMALEKDEKESKKAGSNKGFRSMNEKKHMFATQSRLLSFFSLTTYVYVHRDAFLHLLPSVSLFTITTTTTTTTSPYSFFFSIDGVPSHADAPTNSTSHTPSYMYIHPYLPPLTNEEASSLFLPLHFQNDDDDDVPSPPSHADAPTSSSPSTSHIPWYYKFGTPASTQARAPSPNNYS